MREFIPSLKLVREIIITKILKPNLLYSTFSFDNNIEFRYEYHFGTTVPESLRQVMHTFRSNPDSASARVQTIEEYSTKTAALNTLEQIVGSFQKDDDSRGVIFLIMACMSDFDETNDLLNSSDALVSNPALLSKPEKLARLLRSSEKVDLSKFTEDTLRETLKNANLSRLSNITKVLFNSIKELHCRCEGMVLDQRMALEEAVVVLLKVFAGVFKLFPLEQQIEPHQNLITDFLKYVTYPAYQTINLQDLLGVNVVKDWAKRFPRWAFSIIESQWQYLSAIDLADILICSQRKREHRVNANRFFLSNKKICDKLRSSEESMQKLKAYPEIYGALNKRYQPEAMDILPVVYPPVLAPNPNRPSRISVDGERLKLRVSCEIENDRPNRESSMQLY